MRALITLALLAGCRQIFGLDDVPVHDAASGDGPAHVDSVVDISMGDAPASACDAGDATLVACFDFEGGVADGSQYHEVSMATNVQFGAGVVGMAALVGATSQITVAETPHLDLQAFTLEAWIELSQLPALGAREGVWDTDGQFGLFVLGGGNLGCNTTLQLSVPSVITANQWTHIACTHTTSTTVIYVNGTAVLTQSDPGALSTAGVNGSAIAGNSPSGDPLIGEIDLVRVYTVARSAAQICADAGHTSC